MKRIRLWAAGVLVGFAFGGIVAHLYAVQQTPVAPAQAPQGRGRGMAFTEPAPLDFNDHEGYVSLFDGVSLKGWDGNAKFWRVENGAIVG